MSRFALPLCLLLALMVPAIATADQAGPATVSISGQIGTQDKAPILKASDGTVYRLADDPRSQSLHVMRGQSVEVRAVVTERDGGKVLTVVSYTASDKTEAHELWRHSRCNACVVLPATVNSADPKDLKGATPVTGRYYALKEGLTTWSADARCLWAASDTRVFQVGLGDGKLVRTYGLADGLPDRLVYQVASDGTTLWIAHRAGLAIMDIADGRIADVPEVRFAYGRLAVTGGTAWLIADTGTFRLTGKPFRAEKLAALPTAGRIARLVSDGIWVPHWDRRVGGLIESPTAIGDRLYAGSYGDIYELADGAWKKLAVAACTMKAHAGKLWFLTPRGLNDYDPATGKTEVHTPPPGCRGRYAQLLLTDAAAWVAADPVPGAAGEDPSGGGLARMDLASGAWTDLGTIDGHSTANTACLAADAKGVWVATVEGKYATRGVHPGMTYVERKVLQPTGFVLLRFSEGRWQTCPLASPDLEKRLICGQDGASRPDTICPQGMTELCPTGDRLFAITRLVPRTFFGGYWPCVNQVASRPADGAWQAGFVHAPEQLDLQGEQPQILNISNGELIASDSMLKDVSFEAIGQDNVLGLLAAAGRAWALTEGCIGWFDEAAARWRKTVELPHRWYWRATAILDEGQYVYIGSDRGLITRLDVKSGLFEPQVVLDDRCITRIVRIGPDLILATSEPAALGAMPVQLAGLKSEDWDAAGFDGQHWTKADPNDLAKAPPAEKIPWLFKQLQKTGHMDKSQGNFLWAAGGDKPRYYVREIFYPICLSWSPQSQRMWLSTYTGLLRLDGIKP
ncbi:MAG: hypothetical protein BIFFINMI_01464 [Phycisphaerae bacterium]|nr:hypothetical protein [Phycisphaerae bacterium]